MDDERIRALTDEVLGRLAKERPQGELARRVGALEKDAARPAAAPQRATHIALRVLDVSGGDDTCILEPDKPCTKSGRCRSFGY